MEFYAKAQELLDDGYFVVIGNYSDKISLRYMSKEVLKAKGIYSQLMNVRDEVRIPALLTHSHGLIEFNGAATG